MIRHRIDSSFMKKMMANLSVNYSSLSKIDVSIDEYFRINKAKQAK